MCIAVQWEVSWRSPEHPHAHTFSFNKESSPKRLGNWQVPRWAPTRARPVEMRPNPKPICDDNGHFLPGAPRGSSKCFGHYTGTWDLPRKITRQVAEELAKEPPDSRFSDWLHLRVQRPKIESKIGGRMRGAERGKPAKDKVEAHTEALLKDIETKEQDRRNEDPLELNAQIKPVDADGNGPYIPGIETDEDKRHDSYDLLVNDAIEQVHGPQENQTDKFWRKVSENSRDNEKDDDSMKFDKNNATPKLPYVNVSQNFNFAKKMHTGNLEHEPLPDTLGYRYFSKIGEHRDSDIVVKPYAIGWKGYGASGPTCCTKMRVHRPKTSDPKKNMKDDNNKRPSTSGPGLGSQYKKTLSLMDLAICWDFKPNTIKQEPKPPKHIDGSNGSMAPAVFTMVHTPKDDIKETKEGHAYAIFNQNRNDDDGRHSVPHFEKDMTKEKKKDTCEVQNCPQHNLDKRPNSKTYSQKSSIESAKKECEGSNGCGTASRTRYNSSNSSKSSRNKSTSHICNGVNKLNQSIESYDKTPLAQGKLHQSSPNESLRSGNNRKNSDLANNNTKHKHCTPCNDLKTTNYKIPKDDYKFAFKAGNPNSIQSSSNDSKGVKIPKMRNPYTKKSYTIPTLAPPFTIWRDADATGYPEHWRLASVYQHAYKPPEQRRKPLIASIYQ